MDRGLWRYTRHPNYFGDAAVWWGLTLLALHHAAGLIGLVSAALMTWLLAKGTGAAAAGALDREAAARLRGVRAAHERVLPPAAQEDGVLSQGSVRISAPSAVTRTVCSNWAVRDPSRGDDRPVVVPLLVLARPQVIIGSMVKVIPGSSGM